MKSIEIAALIILAISAAISVQWAQHLGLFIGLEVILVPFMIIIPHLIMFAGLFFLKRKGLLHPALPVIAILLVVLGNLYEYHSIYIDGGFLNSLVMLIVPFFQAGAIAAMVVVIFIGWLRSKRPNAR